MARWAVVEFVNDPVIDLPNLACRDWIDHPLGKGLVMFLLGLLLPIAYVPGYTGTDILTGWIVLSITLPFLLLSPVKMGLGHWLGLIFLSYATLGLTWAYVPTQAVWDLWLFCFADSIKRHCVNLLAKAKTQPDTNLAGAVCLNRQEA